jgi:ABC-type glycerol-3-phosphate transport system substrate-binding protein
MHQRFISSSIAIAFAAFAWIHDATAQQPVVLQWQTANLTESQYEPVWKQTIAEFEAANPGIKVEPVLVARKDHWTKFVAASQAKKAPCIVSVDLTTAAYNGYLLPLDKYYNAEPADFRRAWSDAMLSSAKWKGQLYGLPIWGGTYAEIYNRDLVVKAGLDPAKPPKTFDEYVAWGKKLTGNDQWATAVLGGKTDTTTRVLLMWIWANGGEAFNADMTEATFAKNPKALEAIKFYLAFAGKTAIAAPAPTTTNYLEQTNLYAQGKIATMRNAYWAVAKVVGDNPAMAGKSFVRCPPRTSRTRRRSRQ